MLAVGVVPIAPDALPIRVPEVIVKRLDTAQALAIVYATGFLLLSAANLLTYRYRWPSAVSFFMRLMRAAISESKTLLQTSMRALSDRDVWPWLTVAVLCGAFIRLAFFSQPMRYDEAFTVNSFVDAPVYYTFFYPAPNNHVLHSLFVRFAVAIFGNTPEVARLPAFLSGVGVLFATTLLANSFQLKKMSAFPALMLSVMPNVILYDTMARGYSFVTLCGVLAAGLAWRNVTAPNDGRSLILGVILAAGLYTIPSFAFCVAGILVWCLVATLLNNAAGLTGFVRSWSIALGCGGVLTILGYAPVIFVTDGISPIISNEYVARLPWDVFLKTLPGHVRLSIADTFDPRPAGPIVFVLSTVFFLLMLIRKRQYGMALMLPCMIFGASILLFAKSAIPFSRTWLYFTPFVATTIISGIQHTFNSDKTRFAIGIAMSTCVVVACFWLAKTRPVENYQGTEVARNAKTVISNIASDSTEECVLVAYPIANASLTYYARQAGLSITVRNEQPSVEEINSQKLGPIYFVVQQGRDTLSDMTNESCREVMKIGELTVFSPTEPERDD